MISTKHVWLGQLDADAAVIDKIKDPGNPERRRRLAAHSVADVLQIIKKATGEMPGAPSGSDLNGTVLGHTCS